MRPPQITGENLGGAVVVTSDMRASMRPPQITGENRITYDGE